MGMLLAEMGYSMAAGEMHHKARKTREFHAAAGRITDFPA